MICLVWPETFAVQNGLNERFTMQVQLLSVAARAPVRSTQGSAGFDLFCSHDA
jgi:hypothetical protein